MDNYELYHWGVKGMKWGVRRYQNKDGSLTPAGKKRQRGWSKDAKEAARIDRKKVSQMSNKELQTLNKRRELESKYSQLNPSHIKRGLAIAGGTAAALGTVVSLYSNGTKIIEIGKKFVKKA